MRLYNCVSIVCRKVVQQQSQAWTWALIRPRIGNQGPRMWEAPVELCAPHIPNNKTSVMP